MNRSEQLPTRLVLMFVLWLSSWLPKLLEYFVPRKKMIPESVKDMWHRARADAEKILRTRDPMLQETLRPKKDSRPFATDLLEWMDTAVSTTGLMD